MATAEINGIPWYLIDPDEAGVVTSNPVMVLAHLLPETEADDQTVQKKRAVQLLDEHLRDDPRAKLLRWYIEYDIEEAMAHAGPDAKHAALKRVAAELEAAVDAYVRAGPQLRANEYVAAIDLLGFHALQEEGCTDKSLSRAKQRFSEVLEQRRIRSTPEGRFLWRSPGKWRLYHIARYLNADGDAALDPVYGENYFAPVRC